MVCDGQEFVVICVCFLYGECWVLVEVQVNRQGLNKVCINGLLLKLNELLCYVYVVLFVFEDLQIVWGDLFVCCCFVDQFFIQCILWMVLVFVDYDCVLKQCNVLLKLVCVCGICGEVLSIFDVWDDKFVVFGLEIIIVWQWFVVDLQQLVVDVYEVIVGVDYWLRFEWVLLVDGGDLEEEDGGDFEEIVGVLLGDMVWIVEMF